MTADVQAPVRQDVQVVRVLAVLDATILVQVHVKVAAEVVILQHVWERVPLLVLHIIRCFGIDFLIWIR